MEYNRNQNSYEELQTIVEAHLETIEKLNTKLYKFKTLALEEDVKEAIKEFNKEEELKEEAQRSGYTHNNFKCLIGRIRTGNPDINKWYFDSMLDTLYTQPEGEGGCVVYKKGVWAEKKETEWKLPKKWCIKDCREVAEYASKRFGCSSAISDNRYLHVTEKNNTYTFISIPEYEEITLNQFFQFVSPFKMYKEEVYSLEGASEEQLNKLLTYLKENDRGWERTTIDTLYIVTALKYYQGDNEWKVDLEETEPTRFIKDLL